MTVKGSIRRVWGPSNHQNYVVIVEPVDALDRLVLFTQDVWLASIAERYMVFTGRPMVSVIYDEGTRQLQSVALPVAEAS